MINRRDVLQAGALGAVTAGLVALPPALDARAEPEAAEHVSRRDWRRLADALSARSTLYRTILKPVA